MQNSVEKFFADYKERVRRHYKRFLIAYKKSSVQNNDHIIANSEQMIQFLGAAGYMQRSCGYVGKGDLDSAIRDMNLAIQDMPDVANFHIFRGPMYGEKGDFDKAISDFDKVLRLDPNRAEAYYERSLAYLGKGNFELAFADCTKALTLELSDPIRLQSYLIRGFLYGRNGEFDKAASDFNSALQIKVPNVGNNGSINVEADYHDDARECLKYASMTVEIDKILTNYTDALRDNPNDPKIYKRRGLDFLCNEIFDKAIDDYTMVIQLTPDDLDAYNSRGMAYSQIKEHGKAIKDFDYILKLNPDDASAYRFRGLAYMQIKEYNKAIADLSEAIRLKPNGYIDYVSRGLSYRELRKNDLARHDFEKVLELNPDNMTLTSAKNLLNEIKAEEQERIDIERRKRKEEQQRQEEQRIRDEEQRQKEQSKKWEMDGLCYYCGSELGGKIIKKCKSCKRETQEAIKARENIRKIGRGVSILFAALATVMVIVIDSLDPSGIVNTILFILINLIPFSIIFSSDMGKIGKGITLGIGTLITGIIILYINGEGIEGTIMPSVGLGVCNFISCIIAMIFSKKN